MLINERAECSSAVTPCRPRTISPLNNRGIALLSAQKAQLRGQGATLYTGVSEEVGRVDVVVYKGGVMSVGDVVEARAQRQLIAQERKAALQGQVQREVGRETHRPGRPHQLLVFINHTEGKPGVPIEGISEVALPPEGHPAPGEKAVGGVPGKRPACLRAENWVVNAEIHYGVGSGRGAHVGSKHHVVAFKGVARLNLEGVVMIPAGVAEHVRSG